MRIVRQMQALFAMDGIELQFEPEALTAIAEDANRRPTGARALRSIIEKILKPYFFESPSDPTIKTILITQAVVEGKAEAVIAREHTERAEAKA
jgi:ATP-dependent Clp protease ATP-binding subunit ClpX